MNELIAVVQALREKNAHLKNQTNLSASDLPIDLINQTVDTKGEALLRAKVAPSNRISLSRIVQLAEVENRKAVTLEDHLLPQEVKTVPINLISPIIKGHDQLLSVKTVIKRDRHQQRGKVLTDLRNLSRQDRQENPKVGMKKVLPPQEEKEALLNPINPLGQDQAANQREVMKRDHHQETKVVLTNLISHSELDPDEKPKVSPMDMKEKVSLIKGKHIQTKDHRDLKPRKRNLLLKQKKSG